MKTVHLVNEYPGVLDLSALNDVEGKRVVLQPKGYAGDARECYAEVEEHPHVVAMKNAGRLSVRGGAAPKAAPPAPEPLAPAPEPEPVKAEAKEEVAAQDDLEVKTADASAVVTDEPAPLPTPPQGKKKGRF